MFIDNTQVTIAITDGSFTSEVLGSLIVKESDGKPAIGLFQGKLVQLERINPEKPVARDGVGEYKQIGKPVDIYSVFS